MVGQPESQQDYLQGLLSFIQETVDSYKNSANRAMAQFITVRLGLVVFGAVLPFLTTLDEKMWASGAAVVVAILAGLDTQFQWGEEWRQYRSTELALKRLKREYELRQMSFPDSPIGGVDSDLKNLQKLNSDMEDLLQGHNASFFKFRITPPKAAP